MECLDLRTEDEYNEEHLPGFKNVPFPKFLNEDKTFKSEEGIKNVF